MELNFHKLLLFFFNYLSKITSLEVVHCQCLETYTKVRSLTKISQEN